MSTDLYYLWWTSCWKNEIQCCFAKVDSWSLGCSLCKVLCSFQQNADIRWWCSPLTLPFPVPSTFPCSSPSLVGPGHSPNSQVSSAHLNRPSKGPPKWTQTLFLSTERMFLLFQMKGAGGVSSREKCIQQHFNILESSTGFIVSPKNRYYCIFRLVLLSFSYFSAFSLLSPRFGGLLKLVFFTGPQC